MRQNWRRLEIRQLVTSHLPRRRRRSLSEPELILSAGAGVVGVIDEGNARVAYAGLFADDVGELRGFGPVLWVAKEADFGRVDLTLGLLRDGWNIEAAFFQR